MLSHLSRVQLFATPRTVARQAPLSMGFSRQEHWSGLWCPPLGDLPNPGSDLSLWSLLHWQRSSLPLVSSGKSTRDLLSTGKGVLNSKHLSATFKRLSIIDLFLQLEHLNILHLWSKDKMKKQELRFITVIIVIVCFNKCKLSTYCPQRILQSLGIQPKSHVLFMRLICLL